MKKLDFKEFLNIILSTGEICFDYKKHNYILTSYCNDNVYYLYLFKTDVDEPMVFYEEGPDILILYNNFIQAKIFSNKNIFEEEKNIIVNWTS